MAVAGSAAPFTHVDLFSGIGGFSLAVRALGGQTIGFVEIDPWCRRVLAKHFPEAAFHDDVRTLTADLVRGWARRAGERVSVAHAASDAEEPHPDPRLATSVGGNARLGCGRGGHGQPERPTESGMGIDLITGGYPCQPFSLAGKRLGEQDDRHLWPEMRRLIADLRPRLVLAENVAGHVTMGLDVVLAELEGLGYACGAVVVPAGAVNALHRRDRVWILAHREGIGMAHAEGVPEREPRDDGEAERHQRHARLELGRGGAGLPERSAAPPVADAERSEGQPRHEPAQVGRRADDAQQAGLGRGGTPMADAPARGLRRGGPPGHAGQPACGGEAGALGHANGAGLEGRRIGGGGAGEWPPGTPGGEPLGDAGQVARPLDPQFDGFSAGLVRRPAAGPAVDWDPGVIRAAWADGSWEAGLPRVVSDEPERRQKLQAAGNAIVPVLAYEILRAMLAGEGDDA